MHTSLHRLMQTLGYTFKNPDHLLLALTHRSAHHSNNERFEFIGDSLLNLIISLALYAQFPNEKEGQLSRLRASLVKGDTLASIATDIHLGDHVILGPGELKSGGFRRASILADTLEAIIAAIYFDADFQTCQTVVLRLFKTRIQHCTEVSSTKDPKTQLQEYLQSIKAPLPTYTLVKIEEHPSDPAFHITCTTQSPTIITQGIGSTRRKAEQDAASALLRIIKKTIL